MNIKQHCSDILKQLYIKAEKFASYNNESEYNKEFQIEVDEILYDFSANVEVTDYKYESSTNSTNYIVYVTICKIPKSDIEEINVFLSTHVLNELIYKL